MSQNPLPGEDPATVEISKGGQIDRLFPDRQSYGSHHRGVYEHLQSVQHRHSISFQWPWPRRLEMVPFRVLLGRWLIQMKRPPTNTRPVTDTLGHRPERSSRAAMTKRNLEEQAAAQRVSGFRSPHALPTPVGA